jgi:hypothetical protein
VTACDALHPDNRRTQARAIPVRVPILFLSTIGFGLNRVDGEEQDLGERIIVAVETGVNKL